MKIIAIYGRVSTSRQENEETIKNQLLAINAFAEKRYINEGGYRIVQEYKDDGWSGDSLIRPGLDNLRQDARKKIWDTVIIYDPDRLARRYSYQELVIDELEEAGVEVLFVTTKLPENYDDKIIYGVRGLFSQYERAKIAERFRQGKLRKVREGHILVSEALYGYRYVPKVEVPGSARIHGYYVIDPKESEVVRKIFDWVAKDKLTLRTIVKKLQEEGIKPRKSLRGVWATSTLTTMLRHEGYIGKAHWGSSYAVIPENPTKKEKYRRIKKSSRRAKLKSDWFIIAIPPIVSEDTFFRARHQLEINYKMHPRNRKNDYLLAGMIRCTCGRSRAGEGPKQGTHLYYRCSDRVSSYPLPRTCHRNGLNARIADQLVWDKLTGLMASRSLITKEIERWSKEEDGPRDVVDIKAVQKELSKLKKEEDRYNRAYAEGIFSMEKLKEYLEPVRANIAKLEASLRETERKPQRRDEFLSMLSERVNVALEAPLVLAENLDFATKREIITRTIDQVVGDQEKIKVTGHIPLQTNVEDYSTNNKGVLSLIFTNVELCTNDRNRRPAKRREIDAF
jgi:site-specific DNA recombinase